MLFGNWAAQLVSLSQPAITPEYNGYKVYWADGAQVVAPRDKDIIAEVNAVASFGEIKEMAMDEAQAKGLFQYISEDVDNAFDANVLAQRQAPEIIEEMADDLKIVYTPIHGSGNLPVRRALEKAGFHQVYVVKNRNCPTPISQLLVIRTPKTLRYSCWHRNWQKKKARTSSWALTLTVTV